MLDVFAFIFRCTSQFISMLFTVDLGSGLTLGGLMGIIFIFLPVALLVFGFLKNYFIGESAADIIESRKENSRKGGK